eukprot:TRINITY_DN14736_c6_g3_i2.p1 TRINITY_DN14736_c6_g3~~TRINITY_DN14736_c6_g3_i2.p1  ORF type:complete len:614 (+),score=171.16 TRINITY_DN14736_c6_g3_i2:67-1908(+)
MDGRLAHTLGDFSARRRSGSQPPASQQGVPRLPPALHMGGATRSGGGDPPPQQQHQQQQPREQRSSQQGQATSGGPPRRPAPQGNGAAAASNLRPRPTPSGSGAPTARWRSGGASLRSNTALPYTSTRSPQPAPNSARDARDSGAAETGQEGSPCGTPASRVPAPPPLPNAMSRIPAAAPAAASSGALQGPRGGGVQLPQQRRASCPSSGGSDSSRPAPLAQGAAPLALRNAGRCADDTASSGSSGSLKGQPADGAAEDTTPNPSGVHALADTDALRRCFECPVCLELLFHPICTPCGHHFCRSCLEVSLQRAGKRCPACRAPCHLDAPTHPESTVAAEAIQTLWPDAYAQRSVAAPLLGKASAVLPVVVRAEVAFPGQPVRVRLLDSRYRTQLLQRLLCGGAGKFLLLPAPATPAALPTKGAVGVCCRVDDCSPRRGHVVATATERMRVSSAWQERDAEGDGLCYARCELLSDSDELQSSALAAAWRLRKRLSSFFDAQHPLLKGHVVADAGEEPPLPPLPPAGDGEGEAPRGSTRYSFWAAAVLGVFGILPDGARRGVLTEQLCARRSALLQAGTRHLPTRRSRSPGGSDSAERNAAAVTTAAIVAAAPAP